MPECFINRTIQKLHLIDPYHSMSKQKILPVEPLIQCEAGRAKTMQRQSLYSPRTPKWPQSDKGEYHQKNEGVVSKETVVLRRWGSSIQKFGFINGVDNVNWPPYRDSKS